MMNATNFRISFIQLNTTVAATQNTAILLGHICTTCSLSTVSILLVRKANAKGNVSGFEIAPPSKGGGSDKHLAVN